MLKLDKKTPPEEMRFPSKFAQGKQAANLPAKWVRLR
jgi:hypothetical protein